MSENQQQSESRTGSNDKSQSIWRRIWGVYGGIFLTIKLLQNIVSGC